MKKRLFIFLPIVIIVVAFLVILFIVIIPRNKEMKFVKDAVEAQYKIETGEMTINDFCDTYMSQPDLCSDSRVTQWNINIEPSYTYKIKFQDVEKLDNSTDDMTYYKVTYKFTMKDENGNIVHDNIYNRDYNNLEMTFSIGITKIFGEYVVVRYGNLLNYQQYQ